MCWMDSILMCQNSGHVLNKFFFFLKHWFLNIFISWNCQVILLFRNSFQQNWLSVSRLFCSLETHFLPVEFNFGKALNRSLVTEIMLKLSFILTYSRNPMFRVFVVVVVVCSRYWHQRLKSLVCSCSHLPVIFGFP